MHTQRNTKGNLQAIISSTGGTSSTKERLIHMVFGGSSYEKIELILFILGSWLVIVVDVFILLDFSLQQKLDGSWW
jgi:hypothetical protein